MSMTELSKQMAAAIAEQAEKAKFEIEAQRQRRAAILEGVRDMKEMEIENHKKTIEKYDGLEKLLLADVDAVIAKDHSRLEKLTGEMTNSGKIASIMDRKAKAAE